MKPKKYVSTVRNLGLLMVILLFYSGVAIGRANQNNTTPVLITDTLTCHNNLPGLYAKAKLNLNGVDYKSPLFVAGNLEKLLYTQVEGGLQWLKMLNLRNGQQEIIDTLGKYEKVWYYSDFLMLFTSDKKFYRHFRNENQEIVFLSNRQIVAVSANGKFVATVEGDKIYRYAAMLHTVDSMAIKQMELLTLACGNDGSLLLGFTTVLKDSFILCVLDSSFKTQRTYSFAYPLNGQYIRDLMFNPKYGNECYFIIQNTGIYKFDTKTRQLTLILENCPAKNIQHFTLSDNSVDMVVEIGYPVTFTDNTFYWASTLIKLDMFNHQHYLIDIPNRK